MSEVPLISIVDDDALARDGIRELVETLGYNVITFSFIDYNGHLKINNSLLSVVLRD
jgi:FixJ family two-component response regulator